MPGKPLAFLSWLSGFGGIALRTMLGLVCSCMRRLLAWLLQIIHEVGMSYVFWYRGKEVTPLHIWTVLHICFCFWFFACHVCPMIQEVERTFFLRYGPMKRNYLLRTASADVRKGDVFVSMRWGNYTIRRGWRCPIPFPGVVVLLFDCGFPLRRAMGDGMGKETITYRHWESINW